jgi:hypothetical protein
MSLRTVCLFLLVPTLVLAQAKLEFEKFTSNELGFSILMPGMPKGRSEKVPSPLGELTVKGFVVETNQGKAAWMVTSTDYPAGTVKADNQDAILDGVVKGSTEGVKGKLLTQSKITLGKKHPGRSMQTDVPNTGIYHARVYLVGDRLYQVIMLGPKELATSPDATKFLDSFKLLK